MSRAKKRNLLAVMLVILLITACVSTPVATQNPELIQIEQTVDALAAVPNAQAGEQEPPNASPTHSPAAAEQSAEPAVGNVPFTQTPDPASVSLQETLDAFSAELEAEGSELAAQAVQATETEQQHATEAVGTSEAELDIDIINTVPHPEFPTLGAAEPIFEECVIRIGQENSRPESFSLPKPRVRLMLETGNEIRILQPVNLRSGPTLRHRILMVLRPDPATTSQVTPSPGVTPPSPTVYKIIGGPAYTNIGDETRENANFSVQGRIYKWWQIELPNQRTGWLVEASACGQIQFIEKFS